MDVENMIKDLIKERYGSVREFCIQSKIPYSTLTSMFQNGITNTRINNVLKICSSLQIDADALTEGKVVPIKIKTSSNDIEERLIVLLNWIRSDTPIKFRGEKASPQMIQSVEAAIEIGLKLARKAYEDDLTDL